MYGYKMLISSSLKEKASRCDLLLLSPLLPNTSQLITDLSYRFFSDDLISTSNIILMESGRRLSLKMWSPPPPPSPGHSPRKQSGFFSSDEIKLKKTLGHCAKCGRYQTLQLCTKWESEQTLLQFTHASCKQLIIWPSVGSMNCT